MSARTLNGNYACRDGTTGRRTARPLLLLLAVICFASAARAMPLAEYRSRLHEAVSLLTDGLDKWGRVEGSSGESLKERVERAVPAEETVEWEGGRARVNNAWLREELKKLEGLPPRGQLAKEVFSGVRDRLRAEEERLEEIDAAKPTGDPKAAEKARMEEILRRPEYEEKTPQESRLARLWRRFKEWFNSLFPGRSGLQPGQMSWLSLIAMILVFGLAGGLLGYAIWKLLPVIQRWRGRLKEGESGPRVILGERLSEDQSAADLLREAESLARKGEVRAAIRKAYIALLCELGDRKVLALGQHKTNRDYLRAVRDRRPLLDEMQKLTASFENHWYGLIPATPDDWTSFRSGYQQALNTVTSDE